MKDANIAYIVSNAEEIFKQIRWPNGPECPRCKSHSYYKCANGYYKCKDCGKIYSIKTDSIFHGSHISTELWLLCLYLMLDGKGISSIELARKLGVTQKTAYYMLMRLRYSMNQDDTRLGSEIAMDEIYIGGTWSNFCLKKKQALIEKFKLPKNPRGIKEKLAVANAVNARYKQPVYGMCDGDKIVLQVMPNPVKPENVIECFNKHKGDSGDAVSDCSLLYENWNLFTGYNLHTNNHSKGHFVSDDGFSSNKIEGEFSWLHRNNVFVSVHQRKCYLQLYLNEFAFRYNTRKLSIIEKMEMALKGCSLRYSRSLLRHLNDEEYKLLRKEDSFNPEAFFKQYGDMIKQTTVGGLVYRIEDFS